MKTATELKKLYSEHGNWAAVSRVIGVSERTVQRWAAKLSLAQPGDEGGEYLRKRVRDLESQCKRTSVDSGEIQERMEELRKAIPVCEPPKITYHPTNKASAPCTHVVHLTDLHYGGVTQAAEVDGFGVFNPTVARRRLSNLVHCILDKTEVQRSGYNVPNLHILGTADYISGDIHPELQVTNAMPAPQQAVECGGIIGAMLEAWSPHFAKVTVDLLTLDNHGRLTTKPQAGQGGFNNWSYVVAEFAKQYVSRMPNVGVRVHAKPTALVTVGPERYLLMHGHQIRGWAGKPYYGFDRRVAMEAIKRMGIPEHAFTKMLLGHFHHGFNADVWMLGGSLSGTDAYDHSCGRFGAPHQTGWFIHPRHGEFDWTRWRL